MSLAIRLVAVVGAIVVALIPFAIGLLDVPTETQLAHVVLYWCLVVAATAIALAADCPRKIAVAVLALVATMMPLSLLLISTFGAHRSASVATFNLVRLASQIVESSRQHEPTSEVDDWALQSAIREAKATFGVDAFRMIDPTARDAKDGQRIWFTLRDPRTLVAVDVRGDATITIMDEPY